LSVTTAMVFYLAAGVSFLFGMGAHYLADGRHGPCAGGVAALHQLMESDKTRRG